MLASSSAARSPHSATPALTPPSSSQSYTSARSPISLSSTHNVIPPSHHPQHPHSSSAVYPTLPATTAQDTGSGTYPTVSSAAPPSTLSGMFENDDRRRYTGGMLQRSRPAYEAPSDGSMDMSADTQRGKASTSSPSAPSFPYASRSAKFSASLIDPALRHSSDPSPESDHDAIRSGKNKSPGTTPDAEEASRAVAAAAEAADRAVEQWVANVRLIEKLRSYINERLTRGEYENEDQLSEQSPRSNIHENMEDVDAVTLQSREQEKEQHGSESLYPVLKMNFDDENMKMNVG